MQIVFSIMGSRSYVPWMTTFAETGTGGPVSQPIA